jgi:hypothetical protein
VTITKFSGIAPENWASAQSAPFGGGLVSA